MESSKGGARNRRTFASVRAMSKVLIIGAGVSGLCAAVYLQRAGIPFTIVEKSGEVGGVWRDNHYPGAGVDTPNHLYSYSFSSFDWTKFFVLRDELVAYLRQVADEFGLTEQIRFGTNVEELAYDESDQRWNVRVRTTDGEERTLRPNVCGRWDPIRSRHAHG